MEKQYDHSINGQEVRQQDINLWSANAALADDRVLWELFRPLSGSATPDKLIIPFSNRDWSKISGSTSTALIWGNTADALVHVNPFRAIIGSTTVVGTSPIEHMRGERSGYMLGTSALYRTLTISANASGNPRWDLIYAAVSPDANGDTADVLVKSPTTSGVAAATGTVVTKKTTVTIGRVQGTPGASPARPALPADGGGTYYIPLAYITVPDGFGASSTVTRGSIQSVAPCVRITTSVGASSFAPADEQYKVDGTVFTRQGFSTSAGTKASLPSTMFGSEQIVILLQLGIATTSHQDGDYVDRSRDWRYRYFRWEATGRRGTTDSIEEFASSQGYAGTSAIPDPNTPDPVEHGFGQSFILQGGGLAGNFGPVVTLSGATSGSILRGGGGVAGTLRLYVDDSDGALIVSLSGTVESQIMIWLEATAPYTNWAIV